jgi:hypothetical protein
MPGYSSHDVERVSYHDLDGRPGFKLALHVADGRWYLYATRFWEPGVWILDVTDPAAPEIVGEVAGPDDPNVATWQVQVAGGLLVQGMEHRSLRWGGDPALATDEGVRIFDLAEPARPTLLSQWHSGAKGSHRNYYDGGRHVHVAASARGFDGNIYVILDIDDPANPREVGRWFLPEQYVAAGHRPERRISHHGPAYPVGNRAYLPYGSAGVVVLDISDVTDPRLVSQLDIGAAFSSSIAMHTVVPLPERRLAVVNTEAIAEEVDEPYNFAGIVDLSDETQPRLISLLPPPVPPPSAPYPNFNKRGGRFGPHNQHHHQGNPHLFASAEIVFLTWFNAGLRVYDIRDPYLPKEIGWFLPDDPAERRGLLPRGALVTQSEDVLVDARGYAYVTDKNHGLHVVRFTGRL